MQQNIEDNQDKISLNELFFILKKRFFFITKTTGIFVILSILYLFIATPWWEVSATLEIGKYSTDNGKGEFKYLEGGTTLSERLKIKYIDIYKYTKNCDSKIESIIFSKENPQFITIVARGKSNELALKQLNTLLDEVKLKHKKILESIMIIKESEIKDINRTIYSLTNYQIKNIKENIIFIENLELPTLDQKISSLSSELDRTMSQQKSATSNLSAIENDSSLSALRLAEIQGLEYRISSNKLNLIDLKKEKENMIKSRLPELKREIERLNRVELVKLNETLNLLQSSMKNNNYIDTQIIGNVLKQDKPIKPNSLLILILALFTGTIVSIFIVLLTNNQGQRSIFN